MRVKDLMTLEVEQVSPDATLQDAAVRMREAGVGFLPVGTGGRLDGVLTDRDIVIRAAAQGLDPKVARVRDAMTPQVVSCYEDQLVDEAADMMEARAVRRLLVLDRSERLVGILSIDDLASAPEIEARVGQVLERVVDL